MSLTTITPLSFSGTLATNLLGNYVLSTALTTTLSSYVLTTALTTALADYPTSVSVSAEFATVNENFAAINTYLGL